MSSGQEQIHFDITLTSDTLVTIESEGCSISSEFFLDKSISRSTMNPAMILYSAFAL